MGVLMSACTGLKLDCLFIAVVASRRHNNQECAVSMYILGDFIMKFGVLTTLQMPTLSVPNLRRVRAFVRLNFMYVLPASVLLVRWPLLAPCWTPASLHRKVIPFCSGPSRRWA